MASIVVTRPLPQAAIDRLAEVGDVWMPTDPTPLARDARAVGSARRCLVVA